MLHVIFDAPNEQNTVLKAEADFSALADSSRTLDDFIIDCGTELQAFILAAITKAQEECITEIKSHANGNVNKEVEEKINKLMLTFIEDITVEELQDFQDKFGGTF